jgi:hypothetical protein
VANGSAGRKRITPCDVRMTVKNVLYLRHFLANWRMVHVQTDFPLDASEWTATLR